MPELTDGDVAAVDAGLALDALEGGGHAVLLVQEAVEALPHGRRHGGGAGGARSSARHSRGRVAGSASGTARTRPRRGQEEEEE